jgi:hypothetical protein
VHVEHVGQRLGRRLVERGDVECAGERVVVLVVTDGAAGARRAQVE